MWTRRRLPLGGAAGATGPEANLSETDKAKLAVDATKLAQAPLPTATPGEVTFADTVPLSLRMSLREEVLEQTPEKDDAASQDLIKFHQDQMARKEKQSFQVFHPEAAQALEVQAEIMQGKHLKAQTAEQEAEAKRRKKELVAEAAWTSTWMSWHPSKKDYMMRPSLRCSAKVLAWFAKPTWRPSEPNCVRTGWRATRALRMLYRRPRRTLRRPRRPTAESWRKASDG